MPQTVGLMSKNNRSARVLYVLVHSLSRLFGEREHKTVKFSFSLLGSLSNDDGNGNDNATKQ